MWQEKSNTQELIDKFEQQQQAPLSQTPSQQTQFIIGRVNMPVLGYTMLHGR